MKRITAREFIVMIKENPSVFETWNTPLEITEYVNASHTFITHLSKHLIFSGIDEVGECARFQSCIKLKNASGTFHGTIDFEKSAIKKIENLHVKKTNITGTSASFSLCKKLQIATGEYAGFVSFYKSGIHSIHNLKIKRRGGTYADFTHCPNLQNLGNWDLSKPIDIEPEKLAAEKERRSLKKFHKEAQPKLLPFL
jgi:hypothetical protein